MRKHFRRLAALSPMFVAAGLVGSALLSPVAPAHSQDRDWGWAPSGTAQELPIPRVPSKQIVAYFRQMSAEMDRLNPPVPAESPYAVRLARLTEGLDSHDGLTLDIQAYLVDEVYAYAMADGTVRVSSRLMDALNDDEVRCVIGHEIGHVKLAHGAQRLERVLATHSSALLVGRTDDGLRQVHNSHLERLVQRVIFSRHDRVAEVAADDYALGFMATYDYDREACTTAIDKLAALRGSGRVALLQTHPNSDTRAERMRIRMQ